MHSVELLSYLHLHCVAVVFSSSSASTDNDVVGGQAPNALQKELLDAVKRGNVEKVWSCSTAVLLLTSVPNVSYKITHSICISSIELRASVLLLDKH